MYKQIQNTGTQKDELSIQYVELSVVSSLLWERNSKKHDIGSISESIKKYGFKDPVKYEGSLNGGKGGIVEGNGRVEAIVALKKLKDIREYNEVPRGINEIDGKWYLPVLVGVEAKDQLSAEAYGLDHNNLTMLGGDFTSFDVAKMWNTDEYLEVLHDLAKENVFPVSMDGDSVDALTAILSGLTFDEITSDNEDASDEEGAAINIRLSVSGMDDSLVKDVISKVKSVISDNQWESNVKIHI